MSIRSLLKKHMLVAIGTAVWLSAVGAGARSLLHYANTPGSLASPPVMWPGAAGDRLATPRDTLLVFAHPQCPCTRATISELALIMAQCQGRVRARVYFYAPATEDAAWVKTRVWQEAAEIPDVEVRQDRDGLESQKFGASTSGQVLLYDAAGKLVFNGGITATRGHAGPNDGEDAVVALLRTGKSSRATARVFGCSLRIEEGISR